MIYEVLGVGCFDTPTHFVNCHVKSEEGQRICLQVPYAHNQPVKAGQFLSDNEVREIVKAYVESFDLPEDAIRAVGRMIDDSVPDVSSLRRLQARWQLRRKR